MIIFSSYLLNKYKNRKEEYSVITKVTAENKALYNVLFEKANKAMGFDDIVSLDTYFVALKRLADKNPIFTVLPLDEPLFEIDADARTIKVPDEFKKNGISVQGDEMSEIIYFSVDRYYDTTDLFDPEIHIAIQWEGAPNGKNPGVMGVSMETLRDITTYKHQNKMIFGWALNSHITQRPGTIKFAVRFYKIVSGKIVFNMSTLTQTANINPSLDYTINDNGEFDQKPFYNDRDILNTRLKDSEATEGLVDTPEAPYFLLNLPNNEEGDSAFTDDCWGTVEEKDKWAPDLSKAENKKYYLVDLKENRGEGIPNGYHFRTQASSNDAGKIGYVWHKSPLENGVNTTLTGEINYVLTDDENFSNQHPYYLKKEAEEGEGVPAFIPADITEDMFDTPIPAISIDGGYSKENLYEKYNECDVTEAGYYKVEAQNYNGLGYNKKDSNYIKIPGPGELKLSYDEDAKHLLLNDLGQASVTAQGTTGQKNDIICYSWDDDNDPSELLQEKEVKDETGSGTNNTFNLTTVPEESRLTYDNTVTVSVYARRNGVKTPTQEAKFRITDPAHKPNTSVTNSMVSKRKNKSAQLEIIVNASNIATDKIVYTWKKVINDEALGESENGNPNPNLNDDEIVELPTGNATGEIITNPNNPDFNPKTDISKIKIHCDVVDPVIYYCEIKNVVNNSEAVADPKYIHVSDYI